MNNTPIPPSEIRTPEEVYAGSTVIMCPRTGAVVYMRSPENDLMFANYVSVNRKKFNGVKFNKEMCYSVKLACENMRSCPCNDHECKSAQKIVSELIMATGITVPMTLVPTQPCVNAMVMRTLLWWPSMNREMRCDLLLEGNKSLFKDTSTVLGANLDDEKERDQADFESDLKLVEEGMSAICKSHIGSIIRILLAVRGLTAIKLGKADEYTRADFFNGLEIDIAQALINKENGVSEGFKAFKECWVSKPHFAFSVIMHVISAVHRGFVSMKYQCYKGISAYDTSIQLIVNNAYPSFSMLSGSFRSQKGIHVACNHRGMLDFLFNVTQTYDNKSGVDLYSEDNVCNNFVTFSADHPALLIIRSPMQGQGNNLDEAAVRVEKMIQLLMNTAFDKSNMKMLSAMFIETYGEKYKYILSMNYNDLVIWMAWEYIYQVNVNLCCYHSSSCTFMTTGTCTFIHKNVDEGMALAFMTRLEATVNSIRAEKHAALIQMIESSSSSSSSSSSQKKNIHGIGPSKARLTKPKSPPAFVSEKPISMPQHSRTVNVSQMNRIMRNAPTPMATTEKTSVPISDPEPCSKSETAKKISPIGTLPSGLKRPKPGMGNLDDLDVSDTDEIFDRLIRGMNGFVSDLDRPVWITNPFELKIPSFMAGIM